MQRSPLLRTSFRPRQRPARKFKRRQILPSTKFQTLYTRFSASLSCELFIGPAFFPMPVQAPGNHQMQHQPNPALHSNTNPLPQPPQLHNFLPLHTRHRRFHGPQQERTHNSQALQSRPDNPPLQRLDINRNVRQLRHVSLTLNYATNLGATERFSGEDTIYLSLPSRDRVLFLPSEWPVFRPFLAHSRCNPKHLRSQSLYRIHDGHRVSNTESRSACTYTVHTMRRPNSSLSF